MIDRQAARQIIDSHLRDGASVRLQTVDTCATAVLEAAEEIASAVAEGGKILICGNGGSAADAQHLAAEFVSRLSADFERPGIPAIALTTDSSVLTAYANDIDFDGVFARQVEALGKRGDTLICITTSGRSRNVLRAAEEACRRGIQVVALTGGDGFAIDTVKVVVSVPSGNTQFVQEMHLALEHTICHLVERHLYG